jgi:hypothetical protein
MAATRSYAQDIGTMPTSPGTHPFPVNIVRDAAPSPSQNARVVTLLQAGYGIYLVSTQNAGYYNGRESSCSALTTIQIDG